MTSPSPAHRQLPALLGSVLIDSLQGGLDIEACPFETIAAHAAGQSVPTPGAAVKRPGWGHGAGCEEAVETLTWAAAAVAVQRCTPGQLVHLAARLAADVERRWAPPTSGGPSTPDQTHWEVRLLV